MTREYKVADNIIVRFVDGELSPEKRYELIKSAAIRFALAIEKEKNAPAGGTAETKSETKVTNNIPDLNACVNGKGVQLCAN